MTTKHRFVCGICLREFDTLLDVYNHQNNVHPPKKGNKHVSE